MADWSALPRTLVITGRRVWQSSAQTRPGSCTLVIHDGIIRCALGKYLSLDEPNACTQLTQLLANELTANGGDSTDPPSLANPVGYWDADDLVVMPGVIDAHVHVNQPGRTLWEGMVTATQAAAAGGCTTIVDMPLNSIPPTTTVANAQVKLASVRDSCWVDVALWGGLVPGNHHELQPLLEFGVRGFKGFLIDSGVDEFPMVTDSEVTKAMDILKGHPAPLLFHAELAPCACSKPIPVDNNRRHASDHASMDDAQDYRTFLASRPPEMETAAIEAVIHWLCQNPSVRGHIVHLSTASALPLIRQAKAQGINLTVETCFHYLCLAADMVPPGATQYKCCPPIRDQANRDQLWAALASGDIDFVVSDHSPSTPALKCLDTGDFMKAWGGIAGVQFGLMLLWTEMRRRKLPFNQLLQWLCEGPAQHIQLEARKGRLLPGFDADLVLWDPDTEHEVTPMQSSQLQSSATYWQHLISI
ncbi:Allantoinase [Dimargaris xerosporica]|nr:Allantoinase [Dimargaris xerosporica]